MTERKDEHDNQDRYFRLWQSGKRSRAVSYTHLDVYKRQADYCTQFVVNSPYFKDGFSYQTGVGGASIASTISLSKIMKERNIRMRFGVGGLTKPMCDLLINNQVDCLLDTQDFDLAAVESVKNLKHFRISAGEYADPFKMCIRDRLQVLPFPFLHVWGRSALFLSAAAR